MHVSILSFMSFCGRLLSGRFSPPAGTAAVLIAIPGIGSDVIVKKFHASRFWCLFISSCLFCVAQICGTRIENPHFLSLLSGLTGCKKHEIEIIPRPLLICNISGLRLSLRGLSRPRCGMFWCAWSQPELGLYDISAYCVRQYFQSALRYAWSLSLQKRYLFERG